MKWSDIPTFIQDNGYEVNIPLNYLDAKLTEYETDPAYKLQLNPDFQRGNVWTEAQQIAFVEFFLRGGKTGRVIYFNKPSWDTKATTDYDEFVCVDGLQRLTALRKFMRNELKVFGRYLHDFEESIRLCRSGDNLKFNINSLQTKTEVLQWYVDFNSGGTVHTEDEINRVKEMIITL